MHIAIWIIVGLGLGLWSLAAWGLFMLFGLDPHWVGDLKPRVAQIPGSDSIEGWLPGWQDMLRSLLDLTQTLLDWAGAPGQWVVSLVWAVGSLMILGTGAVLSLLVTLARKK